MRCQELRQFLVEFPKDLNATQAAVRAGYSPHTAKEQGYRMLRVLKTYIQRQDQYPVHLPVHLPGAPWSASFPNQTVSDYQRFLTRLSQLAFFDVRKLFDTHGNPIDVANLSADVAPAIAGFEILEEIEGRGKDRKRIGYTKKYKLVDPLAAIMGLGKVCGSYSERSNRPQNPLEQVATETLLAMKEKIERRQAARRQHQLERQPV